MEVTRVNAAIFRRLFIVCILGISIFTTMQGYAGQREEACVDAAFAKFGISMDLQTDPRIVRDVLYNEMYLGGFSPIVARVSSYLQHPISLRPMLESIRSGILNRHPAIADFLCKAVQDDLLSGVEELSHSRIERVLHHTFLLNEVALGMRDLEFTKQLQLYFEHLKAERGVRQSTCGEFCDVFRVTHSLFQSAKLVTVDKKTMTQYIDYRDRFNLTDNDLVEKNKGLRLNIKEARAADLSRGFMENAMTASVLASSPIQKLWVIGNKSENVVRQKFAQGWPSLYETWNLAFVTGNLDDLDIIYPKLINPQVINIEPDEYLYMRGITLWVTTNIVLLRRLDGIPPLPTSERMKLIAQEWGKINLGYAANFIKSTSDAPMNSFGPGLGWKAYERMRNFYLQISEDLSYYGG